MAAEMELGLANRRMPLTFPAALLPALALLVALFSAASGVSGLALLRLLWAHAQQAGALPRELSRKISGRLLAKLREPRTLRPRNLLGGTVALLAFESLRRVRSALRDSLALMNPAEERLDLRLAERQQAILSSPTWGHGLPRPPRPGQWRPFLHELKDAHENLEEVHGSLGITERKPEELTLDQLTEGVRRVLLMKYSSLVTLTGRYWSREQAQGIAEALAAECGLPVPLPRGGMEEVTPTHMFRHLPWPTPRWLQQAQRLGIAALRPIFLHAWSWTSRFVQTPFGPLHVYDARPPAGSGEEGREEPPLLLQHGLFVTGWSMALLGWLLCRRGRRVIVPDLFDFDHGLSASDAAQSGGEKARSSTRSVEALMCVVRDILEDGAEQLDVCGHSFGGWLVSSLARSCEREGLPLRKVVLLGPGGPFNFLNHSPMARMVNAPMETTDAITPWWIPASAARAVARCGLGVLLSPNNANFIFGLPYNEYFGQDSFGSQQPTLLLWGDRDAIACPRRPRTLGPFLREHFPNLEAYWVRGSGHNLQLDSAVAVARAMDEWLRGGGADGFAGRGGGGGLVEEVLIPLHARLEPMDLSSQSHTWPHREACSRERGGRSGRNRRKATRILAFVSEAKRRKKERSRL